MKILSILLSIHLIFIDSFYALAASPSGVNKASLGYMENCTLASPLALDGIQPLNPCGGGTGVNVSFANTVTLYFKYESTAVDTGYECTLLFADDKFRDLGGALTFLPNSTLNITAGVATASNYVFKRAETIGPDFISVSFPIIADYFRLDCRPHGAGSPQGDTLAVAVTISKI